MLGYGSDIEMKLWCQPTSNTRILWKNPKTERLGENNILKKIFFLFMFSKWQSSDRDIRMFFFILSDINDRSNW